MTTCCFWSQVNDVKPIPLDPHDTYQQFEISNYKTKGSFYAKPVAQDAHSPYFLRIEEWHMITKIPRNFILGEALGLDSNLRAHLPDLKFPLSHESSKAVVVGKWYCSLMFIKDGILTLRGQMEKSMFYEMTLEKNWELMFESANTEHTSVVMVDAVVQRETVLVGGSEDVQDKESVVDKIIWFKSFVSKGEDVSVGLSVEIVRKNEMGGRKSWLGNREEEFEEGVNRWRKFEGYVLVERFVLKRMDGSLVMTYDFKHTHQIKCLWD